MGYDVFISYSHGGDDLLSERVQDALTKFAKPWWRRRALNVFRDRSALAANPGLWSAIAEAIDGSRYFLMLASPDAAASVWCGREVERWRSKHGSDGLLVLQTDGEILWDEGRNDFNWGVTTALASTTFSGCFQEEPRHVDMRWARSATQLDLGNGRFRDQIAELAAPVHGMAKDELAGEDVKQHRRAVRQATAAGVALVLLTFASIATSVLAVNAAGAARRNAAKAVKETAYARSQETIALHASVRATNATLLAVRRGTEANQQRQLALRRQQQAQESAEEASKQRALAQTRALDLSVANGNLNTANLSLNTDNTNLKIGSQALRKSTLLAEARLAGRRSEQLMSSGDQTYELGVLLAAEAVRHACASSAIDPSVVSSADVSYPDPGCVQPGVQIDPSVASSALVALSNAGGKFVTGRLAGAGADEPVAWSSDGTRLATYSLAQSNPPQVVQVWNRDGSLAATATSTTGLTSESALSGDGKVLGLTSAVSAGRANSGAALRRYASQGNGSVSAWSLSSGSAMPGSGLAGRRPSLSANGAAMAWLPLHQARAVEIETARSGPRLVSLSSVPVGVAMSPDGSLVAALVYRGKDDYALIPIDAVTGRVGAARDLGSFATTSHWVNRPRVSRSAETVDPPSLQFAPTGTTVWVYNNQEHIGVQLLHGGRAPTARIATRREVPASDVGDLSNLYTSTPDGLTVVLFTSGTIPTYEVFTDTATGWTTTGVAPLELCISQGTCNVSISPNGTELAVTSLSALQIINLLAPASASSAIVASPGPVPASASVVMAPTGQTALSWNAHVLVMVGTVDHAAHRVALPLGAGESIEAVGSDPHGAHFIAVIGRGSSCPCRIVILDAWTGNIVGGVRLGPSAINRIPHETAVGVALDDAADVVAVTYDNDPNMSSGSHRCALATYSVASGQPLQASENTELGVGDDTVSVPAFQPGTDTVALEATQATSHEVNGVLMDGHSGVIADRFSMSSGAVTVDSGNTNDDFALRFSPNGQLLGWNTGGSVVIWDLGTPGGSHSVVSDVVLTSPVFFDPTSLAVSDSGQVATVGFNDYSGPNNDSNDVVLTGDELGRFLQPLGIARLDPVPSGQTQQSQGQTSVAMPGNTGEIAAVAVDTHGGRFFTDTWGAVPGSLLDQLCAAAPRALTMGEWETYFPGEPYVPACLNPSTPASRAIDASALPAQAFMTLVRPSRHHARPPHQNLRPSPRPEATGYRTRCSLTINPASRETQRRGWGVDGMRRDANASATAASQEPRERRTC